MTTTNLGTTPTPPFSQTGYHLTIRATGGAVRPVAPSLGATTGGPHTLLRWLETHLALTTAPLPLSRRVADLLPALAGLPEASFAASLRADEWATATELLSRYDELRLAGWDGAAPSSEIPLLRDLARLPADHPSLASTTAARLARILAALDAGQALPPHRVTLLDAAADWPAPWRAVLNRLDLAPASADPAAPAGSTAPPAPAPAATTAAPTPTASPLPPTTTLRHLSARSAFAAAEAVAAALAADTADDPASLAATTVCCADPHTALLLDDELARLGLPTMGASVRAGTHPALQVLPLALELCWEPVDPALLIDFLGLPLCPIPRRAARALAGALGEQPGLGSRAWEKARADVASAENDPEGEIAKRLAGWFDHDRVRRGHAFPAKLADDRARRVGSWAAKRAGAVRDRDPRSASALDAVAGQASALRDLLSAAGDEISGAQLGRLVEAAGGFGLAAAPHPPRAGGPTWVSSPADIHEPCARLVWMGVGAHARRPCRWTQSELRDLREAGIAIDDGARAVRLHRAAERRGLARVEESLLAVTLPDDDAQRPHPLWQRILATLPEEERAPTPLDALLDGRTGADALAPWRFPSRTWPVAPPQPPRQLWHVAPGLLADRERSSASDLEIRLGCPLAWVFRYPASLYPGAAASVPDDLKLKGSFLHAVLAEVFDPAGAHGPGDAEQAALAVFDERVGLDAAPLARPGGAVDLMRLRDNLRRAVGTLVRVLEDGGYVVAAMEEPFDEVVDGRRIRGYIDCRLADAKDGGKKKGAAAPGGAIVNFKLGRAPARHALLADGRALQLATYAAAQGERPFPAAAYLILFTNTLLTPAGSPVRGAAAEEIVDGGPPIEDVWRRFVAAIDAASGWLGGGDPVPARPIQNPALWPEGAELALVPWAPGEDRPDQPPCEYCNYPALCGLRRLS